MTTVDHPSATIPDGTATHPHLRPWMIVAVVCIPVFLGSLDLTIVSAFLPALTIDLNLPLTSASLESVSWVLTVYLLSYSVSLFIWGRVSDLIGRRAAFLICLLLYLAGALLVVLYRIPAGLLGGLYGVIGLDVTAAHINLHGVLVARIIAAFGAGAITAIALALVGDLFPAGRRAVALGVIAAMDTLGWLIGAAWAGLVVQVLPWQALFLINMPLVAAALVLLMWSLRRVPRQTTGGRFDGVGMLLIITTLTLLTVALASIRVSDGRLDLTQTLPLLAASGGSFAILLIVEARTRDPLINLDMFRRSRAYSAATLMNLLIGFCLFIAFVLLPLLANLREIDAIGDGGAITLFRDIALQQAALVGGVMMFALTLPLALSSMAGGWLIRQFGVVRITLTGTLIALVGFLLLQRNLTLAIPLPLISSIMAGIGIGIGVIFTAVLVVTLRAAHESERGAASALVLGVRMVSMTIATSTLTVFTTQRVIDLIYVIEARETISRAMLERTPPDLFPVVFAPTYNVASAQALGEMALFGALLCGIAVIPALLLGRNGHGEAER